MSSGQLELELPDPDEDDVGQWHAPDSEAPETEREAAIAVYPRTGTGRRKVLDALAELGAYGATDEELAELTGLRHYTAAPRRHELLRGGWIEDSGRRRPTTSGARAAVWVVSARGLADSRKVA